MCGERQAFLCLHPDIRPLTCARNALVYPDNLEISVPTPNRLQTTYVPVTVSYLAERLPHRDLLRLDLVTVMICHVGLASHYFFVFFYYQIRGMVFSILVQQLKNALKNFSAYVFMPQRFLPSWGQGLLNFSVAVERCVKNFFRILCIRFYALEIFKRLVRTCMIAFQTLRPSSFTWYLTILSMAVLALGMPTLINL